MKYIRFTICMVLLLQVFACSNKMLFNSYRKEKFPVTKITESQTKTIQILNRGGEIQRILGIAFYADSNNDGHFQVDEVMVGREKFDMDEAFVPPMGALNLTITYAPLNFETTEASFGGWITTSEDRGEVEDVNLPETSGVLPRFTRPQNGREGATQAPIIEEKGAVQVMTTMMKSEDEDQDRDKDDNLKEIRPVIHRAMLVIAYDQPEAGYVHIELIGGAVPGPNGEITAVGSGGAGGAVGEAGECTASGTTACFRGTFTIDLPGLMSGGGVEVPISRPVPFKIDAEAAELNMDEFPPILIALSGNGPGEPLEGKPVSAISIVISGTKGAIGTGSFDGRILTLSDVGFRVRVLLDEITEEDITPGLVGAADFDIEGLEIITEESLDGSKIVFMAETTLSATPSGNGLFDSFLGGAKVIVRFNGNLELP